MIDTIIDSIGEYIGGPFLALKHLGKNSGTISYILILGFLVGVSAHFGFGLPIFKTSMMAFGVLAAIYSVSFTVRAR